MVKLKSEKEIEILRQGGKILAGIMQELISLVKPGVSTYFLNEEAERLALLSKARPSFKGYSTGSGPAYPCALCTSINDEVVHGIGKKSRILASGEIISMDMGIEYKGLFTDHAVTVPVGKISKESLNLMRVTKNALNKGIVAVKPGAFLSDVSKAIQKSVERKGYSVVRELVGHGVGYAVHEDPVVPNYYAPKIYPRIEMKPGLVIAIEPMVNNGSWQVDTDPDGWTVRTSDGSLSAHFEHTVVVTETGHEIITLL